MPSCVQSVFYGQQMAFPGPLAFKTTEIHRWLPSAIWDSAHIWDYIFFARRGEHSDAQPLSNKSWKPFKRPVWMNNSDSGHVSTQRLQMCKEKRLPSLDTKNWKIQSIPLKIFDMLLRQTERWRKKKTAFRPTQTFSAWKSLQMDVFRSAVKGRMPPCMTCLLQYKQWNRVLYK